MVGSGAPGPMRDVGVSLPTGGGVGDVWTWEDNGGRCLQESVGLSTTRILGRVERQWERGGGLGSWGQTVFREKVMTRNPC